MQGETPLPFKTMSITIPENTQFGADIRRAIKASSPNTQIIELDDLNKAFQDLESKKCSVGRVNQSFQNFLAQYVHRGAVAASERGPNCAPGVSQRSRQGGGV